MKSSCFTIATVNEACHSTLHKLNIKFEQVYIMCGYQSHQQLLLPLMLWDTYESQAVENTSANVEWNDFAKVESRKKNINIILMGCPCHIAYNTSNNNFNAEELLVGNCFHFDYSLKWKKSSPWVFWILQSPIFFSHQVLQYLLASYVNMQRKSSITSSIPKKLFPILEFFHEEIWREI